MENASSQIDLSIQNLTYRYPGGPAVLNQVSFSVQSGEVVGLVGPSGAGKSTLLMHLNGLLPEESARSENSAAVTVHGLPVVKDHLKDIRRAVGFLFQVPGDQLFCPTVLEDVAFGPLNLGVPQQEVRDRVTTALESVGLAGYEQRSTLQLSVGERKRVCLAGILACQPSVLALDEPFSNLDPRARRALLEILKSFEGSQIVATHDLNLVVELCSRVLVLDNGSIQADGPTHEILADKKLMDDHGLEVPFELR